MHRGLFYAESTRKIYGILLNIRGILLNIRGKSENFGENRGIFEENARKIGEFPRNPFLEVAEPKGNPAVVSGRFRSFLLVIHSFFRSFPVIFRLIPIDSGKSFLFIPFHSFLFLLLLKSPRFYALKHISYRYFVREVECLKYYCYFCT